MNAISVAAWGFGTSIRDGGRLGRAGLGVSRGGAVDLGSLRLANRLVGNGADVAAIETSGGFEIVFQRPVMVAVCGALGDITVVGGLPVGWGAPVVLPAGAQLRVGRLTGGARVYVAIRGGVSAIGDDLAVGPDPGTPAAVENAPRRAAPSSIRVWPGPRRDWFTPAAWQHLVSDTYTVSTQSDRVGSRLIGPQLDRIVTAELAPEGVVEGAIQVPPDGQPIVMLADHPTTGGYPVIAVVDPDDIGHLAQLPPGAVVRFSAAR